MRAGLGKQTGVALLGIFLFLLFSGCAPRKQTLMDGIDSLDRGFAYDAEGKYDQELSDYNKVLEINPRDAVAYYNRGVTYGWKDQYEQAILDYNKALEINPKDAAAYVNRGLAYGRGGQYDEGISDFNKALEINPRYAVAQAAGYLSKTAMTRDRRGARNFQLHRVRYS